MMSNIHVTAKVNGDETEFLCDPRETLLDVLRDRLNLTGTKEGCGTYGKLYEMGLSLERSRKSYGSR